MEKNPYSPITEPASHKWWNDKPIKEQVKDMVDKSGLRQPVNFEGKDRRTSFDENFGQESAEKLKLFFRSPTPESFDGSKNASLRHDELGLMPQLTPVEVELSELQEKYNKLDKISDIQDKMLECLTDYINKTNKTFFADSKEPTHGSIFKLLNYDLERLKAGLKEQ